MHGGWIESIQSNSVRQIDFNTSLVDEACERKRAKAEKPESGPNRS